MILEAGKELGDPSNGNPSKDTETEKMAVAADDHLGVSGNRALEYAVGSASIAWMTPSGGRAG